MSVKDIDRIIELVNKSLGKGTLYRASDGARSEVSGTITTGFAAIDHYVLGCGGIPMGRIGELFSEEGIGKSGLALHLIARAQAGGGLAMLVETENGYNPERCATYGVNTDELILSEPEHLEDSWAEVYTVLETVKKPILIVYDSLAAVPTKAELEKGLVDPTQKMAEKAAAMSKVMRVLPAMLIKHKAALLIVNQTRHKVGVLFGPKTTTPGGDAVKFHASWRLCMYPGKAIKEGAEHIGKRVTVMAVKNRFAPPFRKVRLVLSYHHGWDEMTTLIGFAKDRKLIDKKARNTPETYDAALAACNERRWKFTAAEEPDDEDEEDVL